MINNLSKPVVAETPAEVNGMHSSNRHAEELRAKILNRLEYKNNLPSFPDLLLKLQVIISDPHTSIREIAKLIELDPTLAGNILKMANSAFYSRLQPVQSVAGALSHLGLERVKQFVFSLTLSRLFQDNRIINHFGFWRHSLSVALFTQSLSDYIRVTGSVREVVYLAGLMHDIGILVFAYLVPDDYAAFLKQANSQYETLPCQEKRYFGVTHQELGALFISRWWKVNIGIIQAVRYHHSPFECAPEDRLCTQLVNLANGICNTQGYSHGMTPCHDGFHEGAWQELGMSLSFIDTILKDVDHALHQAIELLGYSGTPLARDHLKSPAASGRII